VKTALKEDGIAARSHAGHVLFEPWTVETGTGGFYRVYTPFWKAVRGRDPGAVAVAAETGRAGYLAAHRCCRGDGAGQGDEPGCGGVRPHLNIGEEAARGRLDAFIDTGIADYAEARDDLGRNGTSNLSENLTMARCPRGPAGGRACARWRRASPAPRPS
jgi:deoxyribodipyrimidine photo-lyase